MIRLRRHFNTSHVTVYHLTVDFNDSDIILFQYISCYCLSIRRTDFIAGGYISIHLMLLFITVAGKIIEPKIWFQYISCYCLSALLPTPTYNVPSFQYISCYCLSGKVMRKRGFFSYFNTSHVTVYLTAGIMRQCLNIFQYISCYCLSR